MYEGINYDRRRFLSAAAKTIAAAHLAFLVPARTQSSKASSVAEEKSVMGKMTPGEIQLPIEGEVPSLRGADGWLNSQPLTAGDLRGHVVLIDIWTYTCINWMRTLPYVRAWAE